MEQALLSPQGDDQGDEQSNEEPVFWTNLGPRDQEASSLVIKQIEKSLVNVLKLSQVQQVLLTKARAQRLNEKTSKML